jgi:hypothetical protein
VFRWAGAAAPAQRCFESLAADCWLDINPSVSAGDDSLPLRGLADEHLSRRCIATMCDAMMRHK